MGNDKRGDAQENWIFQMKNLIWFVKKMFQITPQVWEVRKAKNVAVIIYGENNKKMFNSFKRQLTKIITDQEAIIVRKWK